MAAARRAGSHLIYVSTNAVFDGKHAPYREGDRVGVFDLDFGRICTKICNDVNGPDIDRVAALHQVDLLLLHTQDGGPYSENIRTREMHRCIDCGYYLLRAGSRKEHHGARLTGQIVGHRAAE